MWAFIYIDASCGGIPGVTFRTLTVVTAHSVDTFRSFAARRLRSPAFVHVHAPRLWARIPLVASRTAAGVTALGVRALGAGATRISSAFVEIVAFSEWVSIVTARAEALITAWYVFAFSSMTAGIRIQAFVDIRAGDGGVARVPGRTFAHVVAGQIAALRILHADGSQRRDFAFVDIVAFESIAFVSWEAGTVEAAHGVCTVRKHIAGPVLAFIFVWHLAAFSSETIVTVAKVVQAHSVDAARHFRVAEVSVRAFEFIRYLV